VRCSDFSVNEREKVRRCKTLADVDDRADAKVESA